MFLKSFRRTPLAWRQLMKERTRLIIAAAGIGFADILMFFQLGLQDSLYDGATQSYRLLEADLVMTSSNFKSLAAMQTFPREHLHQALGYEGVKSISPIYINTGNWKNPTNSQNRAILVWGVEPELPSFSLPEIEENIQQLKLLNRILFDRASNPVYGKIPDLLQQQGNLEIELNRQTIEVSGLFTLGASFSADGNVITSDSTFLKLFPERQTNQIDIGLIQLQPGVDIKKIQAHLRMGLTKDIKILTPQELAAVEKYYWESQGTIGFIFGMGVLVGFIVGIVIVYQILYTDVANHLPEYATLKAMGYSDRYLVGVLLQAALILAIFGYIPGFIISVGLYQITYTATLLPVGMTVERAVLVLILTFVMCSVSGAIAMRKVQSADPADIF